MNQSRMPVRVHADGRMLDPWATGSADPEVVAPLVAAGLVAVVEEVVPVVVPEPVKGRKAAAVVEEQA